MRATREKLTCGPRLYVGSMDRWILDAGTVTDLATRRDNPVPRRFSIPSLLLLTFILLTSLLLRRDQIIERSPDDFTRAVAQFCARSNRALYRASYREGTDIRILSVAEFETAVCLILDFRLRIFDSVTRVAVNRE